MNSMDLDMSYVCKGLTDLSLQLDSEGGPHIYHRVMHIDTPTVILIDNPTCEGESEPPPTLTSRDSRAEDLPLLPLRYPLPRIRDVYIDHTLLHHVGEGDRPLPMHGI